ncbi:hypothetical protein [Bradyrhizobium elkanii]|uniref:hypothetical protein n=1 Tax=Bradyrhizobium elkanii TaxID=29448 RepID=UPI003D195FB3
MSLATTHRKEAAAAALHKRQDELVGEYLQRFGELEKDWLYNVGLPECGRIKNPGQRIRELRLAGWHIKTDTDRIPGKCFYVLQSMPDGLLPEPERAPSFDGFGRYLKRIRVEEWRLSKVDRAAHYSNYCAEIRRQNA